MSDVKAGELEVTVQKRGGAHFRKTDVGLDDSQGAGVSIVDEHRDKRWWNSRVALFGITLVGAALRIAGLGRQSYWLDEGASVYYVQQHYGVWSIVESLARGGDNHTPLHFLALYGMSQFFDLTNEVAMRAPSVFASVLLIPAAWMLASVVAPRFRAFASVLAAVSPFLIWYAQEARMYAMAEAFAAWSIVAFFKSTSKGATKRWLVLHAVCRVLGFYTHVYAILLSVSEILLLPSISRDRRKALIKTMAIEFLLALPWFAVLYNARGNTAGTDTGSPIVAAAYSLFVFAFGYSFGPGVRSLHISRDLSTIDMVQLGAAALVSVGLLYAAYRSRKIPRLGQLSLVVGTPIVLAAMVTVLSAVTLNARYLSIVYVPFVCLVALVIGKQWSSKIVKLAAVVLAAVTVVSLGQYWTMTKYEKDDYRAAMQYIDAHNSSNDPILVLTYPAPALVYAKDQSQVINLAPDGIGAVNWNGVRGGTLPVGNAWVLYARTWELDTNGSHLRMLQQRGTLTDEASFAGVRVMHLTRPV